MCGFREIVAGVFGKLVRSTETSRKLTQRRSDVDATSFRSSSARFFCPIIHVSLITAKRLSQAHAGYLAYQKKAPRVDIRLPNWIAQSWNLHRNSKVARARRYTSIAAKAMGTCYTSGKARIAIRVCLKLRRTENVVPACPNSTSFRSFVPSRGRVPPQGFSPKSAGIFDRHGEHSDTDALITNRLMDRKLAKRKTYRSERVFFFFCNVWGHSNVEAMEREGISK